ncbi:MAG: hypothetical protein DLM73_15445 [Chthoniobacterales bacterium]|nr:MAG: hypothetical protein DLM73_15445 [Chthoniobacterales bacterium]
MKRCRENLGSARLQRAGDGVLAVADFPTHHPNVPFVLTERSFRQNAETRSPRRPRPKSWLHRELVD